MYAHRHRIERSFEVGDLIYLWLQPYRQTIGQLIAPSTKLPPLDDEGLLVLIPERIVQTRERKLWNRVIREYLVQWKELPTEDATWEGEQVLQHPNLQLLEDKQSQSGRTVMSSFD